MGAGVTDTEAKSVEHQEGPTPTLEVALESVPIYLPEDPVIINGEPFSFLVNEERVAEVMDETARTITGFSWMRTEPRVVPDLGISVRLSDTLPAALRDVEDAETVEGKHYDPKEGMIKLVLPPEVRSDVISTEDIKAHYEIELRQMLANGLIQYSQYKSAGNKLVNFWKLQLKGTGPAVGAATALAAFQETHENAGTLLARGTVGAAVGAGVMFLAATGHMLISNVGKGMYERRLSRAVRYTNTYPGTTRARSIRESLNLGEIVISLQPVQAVSNTS